MKSRAILAGVVLGAGLFLPACIDLSKPTPEEKAVERAEQRAALAKAERKAHWAPVKVDVATWALFVLLGSGACYALAKAGGGIYKSAVEAKAEAHRARLLKDYVFEGPNAELPIPIVQLPQVAIPSHMQSNVRAIAEAHRRQVVFPEGASSYTANLGNDRPPEIPVSVPEVEQPKPIIPRPFPELVHSGMLARGKPIYLGETEDGPLAVLWFGEPVGLYSILISGETGSGKTWWITSLLIQAVINQGVRLALADPLGHSIKSLTQRLKPLLDVPGVLLDGLPVPLTREEAADPALVVRHMAETAKVVVRQVDERIALGRWDFPIILAFDDLLSAFGDMERHAPGLFGEFKENVAKILTRGRHCDVAIVGASQLVGAGEMGGRKTRNPFPSSAVFASRDTEISLATGLARRSMPKDMGELPAGWCYVTLKGDRRPVKVAAPVMTGAPEGQIADSDARMAAALLVGAPNLSVGHSGSPGASSSEGSSDGGFIEGSPDLRTAAEPWANFSEPNPEPGPFQARSEPGRTGEPRPNLHVVPDLESSPRAHAREEGEFGSSLEGPELVIAEDATDADIRGWLLAGVSQPECTLRLTGRRKGERYQKERKRVLRIAAELELPED